MKIAQVVNTFPPVHGGMGFVCYEYARELARRGHDVTVLVPRDARAGGGYWTAGFSVHVLDPLLRYGDGVLLPQLAGRLRPFDLVQVHYPFYGGAEYVYAAARRHGVPYVLTYHMDSYGNRRLQGLIIRLYESVLLKPLLRRARRVTGPGRAYLATTKAARFVRWDRVADMPHAGVDTKRFAPRPRDAGLVRQHGLRDRRVVLFAGNLQPFKGLHLLIDALAASSRDDIVLLIVGGGYGEERYRRQVAAAGLANRTVFAGPQSRDALLPAYYNLADVLVLPSTHSESYGLVVLEAMASGIPAIVSDLPGPAQLVEDGTDGFVVPVNDPAALRSKIDTLLGDPALRERMGRTALAKVRGRYTWTRVGDALESVLRSAASPNN